jgi:hypothetical protein
MWYKGQLLWENIAPVFDQFPEYCGQGESVRFAYVTSLRVEGKQKHMMREPEALPTQEMRQRATKYCRWEIMFVVWTVYASLSATHSHPFDPLALYF